MVSSENLSNFVPDVKTDMEGSSQNWRTFDPGWNRSLNFAVFGPIELKFDVYEYFRILQLADLETTRGR